MDNKFDYTETIENYIRGEMSGDQRLQFENQLNQDPLLKEELHLQQDLIQSIQGIRKAELKARLDGIQIGIFDGLTTTTGFKIVLATLITTMVGAGGYYAFFDKNPKPIEQISSQEQPTVITRENEGLSILDSLEERKDEKKTTLDKDTVKNSRKVSDQDLIAKAEDRKVVTDDKKQEIKEEEPADFNPVLPDLNDNFIEEDSTPDNDIDVPDNELGPSATETKGDFEIDTNSGTRNNFHYRFKQDKLILFGDFSGSTYEIIELNSSLGKSYYLYFNENFYPLNVENTKVTELRVLTDKTLIEELKKIKGDN
jgi:hypothetical protein